MSHHLRPLSICLSVTSIILASSRAGHATPVTQSPADDKPTAPTPPLTTDLVNAGTLVAYGFTIGGGLSVSFGGDVVKQTLPTFMPYVALFPGAWFVHGDISKAYCTGRFISGPTAAETYANSLAEYRTRKRLGKSEVNDTEVNSATQWDRTERGRCGLFTWAGIYIGKPSGMKVNSTYAGSSQDRDFTSYLSAGLITSPIAYFSAFAGVTWWTYEDGDAKTNRNTRTFTVGLGTNLDVISQFFK